MEAALVDLAGQPEPDPEPWDVLREPVAINAMTFCWGTGFWALRAPAAGTRITVDRQDLADLAADFEHNLAWLMMLRWERPFAYASFIARALAYLRMPHQQKNPEYSSSIAAHILANAPTDSPASRAEVAELVAYAVRVMTWDRGPIMAAARDERGGYLLGRREWTSQVARVSAYAHELVATAVVIDNYGLPTRKRLDFVRGAYVHAELGEGSHPVGV